MGSTTFRCIGKKKPLERFTHPLPPSPLEISRARHGTGLGLTIICMQGDAKVKGIWIKQRCDDEPDIVIYYAHGKTCPATRVAGALTHANYVRRRVRHGLKLLLL
jgi:hypothetical protein